MTDTTGPRERFTDEELAFLRYVRFGELPERVSPAEWVETAETDPPEPFPNRRDDPRHWGGVNPV
ncbi:hypothetical protein ACWDWO_09975 [Actinopolymorpha singaporensis]|uniref:Uncharacterized protein n=1 Tax=Actinopolymorpha singaporensis TaxID=117157 RepID=A0A1H1L1H7_9ACTN|nr:hypothetical protein [Actinopolymorpha singaporensis]SDR68431.1 hypothetical protein SAMN04489717_0043 [Actinopolymorpha singaporensis]